MATLWTIRIALVFYFAAIAVSLRDASQKTDRTARLAWTIAFVFYLAHVVAAFQFAHGWSHVAAYEHTVKRTTDVVGLAFGGGIYVNYAFTLIWLLDVAWWWINPAGYRARPRWMTCSLHALFAFIVFNATVVFGEGPIRWVGLAAFIAIATCWIARRQRATR